ncbi:MAG: o-succinylbenzoate synthase [Gemmatimonadetes bacterium]|nr:o-succinylbenzoate synthase [Gemmatimonadota bacterium]
MSDRVSRIRLHEVALPLREPFVISGGTLTIRRSLIVELEDDQGRRGFGESAPFELPFYSAETIASARACLTDLLLPRILGVEIGEPQRAHEALADGVRGNRMARAGVETAWWDLCAAREGVSLADLVSRRLADLEVPPRWRERRDRITCGVALGVPSHHDRGTLRTWVREALALGYQRVKLKVRPGWDVVPVAIAREEMARAGRAVSLWVDANGAYDAERHREALAALDRCQLLFIEQPLGEDHLWDSRELARWLKTPVCLDESLVSDATARQVLAMDGPRIWNLKIQRVGGLEEACRIYARAAAAGVRLWGGTMPETGLGAQAMLALGGHAGFVFPSDIEPSTRWYPPGTDLVELTMERDGTMQVPVVRPDIQLEGKARLIADWAVRRGGRKGR